MSHDSVTAAGHPTPYPELNAVLRELVESAQAILQDGFVAACLHGSFSVGDFDRHSDVDFLIVVKHELTDEQVQSLQAMHGRIYDLECPWAQHLEGSYIPKEVLRRAPRPGETLWYIDNGSRVLILSTHDNTLVVRWQAREKGVALAGPEPATLIDPVPVDALRREIRAVMHDWGREILSDPERINNRFYQTFAVLSYCRMLHSLHAGRIGSKREGAEWVKATRPDPRWQDLIDRAWLGRPNPAISARQSADPEDLRRTLEFVRYILAESAAYADEGADAAVP